MARPTAEIRESDVPVSFDNAADEAAMVGIAMQTLSPDHREVLILKYVVGLSSAEIGQVVGKKTEAIDSMLQRARSAFEQTWLQITSEEVKQ
jgi:RNA polymerase sigma factor (sigma-70 family)